MVRNRVVALKEAISQDELHTISNYLNQNFHGWTIPEIQREMELRLEQESAAYDAILKNLNLLFEKGLLDIEQEGEIHMEGASNLVGFDLHLTREKMRELFRALEQKKKMVHLLDRLLNERHGEVGVRVGLRDMHPAMGELSMIGFQVNLPNGLSGKIAVLGPMRMNYERAMSAVLHVGQAFQSVLV
jgi:heat-inducible transcriptional repressor